MHIAYLTLLHYLFWEEGLEDPCLVPYLYVEMPVNYAMMLPLDTPIQEYSSPPFMEEELGKDSVLPIPYENQDLD